MIQYVHRCRAQRALLCNVNMAVRAWAMLGVAAHCKHMQVTTFWVIAMWNYAYIGIQAHTSAETLKIQRTIIHALVLLTRRSTASLPWSGIASSVRRNDQLYNHISMYERLTSTRISPLSRRT